MTGLILFVSLFSVFRFGRTTGNFETILLIIGMSWLGVFMLTFVSFLAADIITGFGFFFPRYASQVRMWALLGGILLSLTAFVQGGRAPAIDSYELFLSDLPKDLDGTVMAAMGDTHVSAQISNEWLTSRVGQINELKPDIILLLGDIIDSSNSDKKNDVSASLTRLSAPLGVWAVLGNHEFLDSSDSDVTSIFDKAHIPVLRGTWKQLKPGLILAGVDFPGRSMGMRESTPDTITPALAGRPEGATILLSHSPSGIEEAARAGVDLMLCAHTHGGQIWPFSYIVQAVYHMISGEYMINGMPVIVTRGAGTWGPHMRLWKRGEILRITLRTKGAQQ
jgi:uncharacterized protein